MESKLLILDIDETLLYSSRTTLPRTEDFKVGDYFVYTRPGLREFVKFVQDSFEIAVWTASTAAYAKSVLAKVFPDPGILRFAWSRERCTVRYNAELRQSYWVKDLKKVKKLGYSLDSVLVVDDSPEKLERSYGNHVPVQPFLGDPRDDELYFLQRYLIRLKDVASVRSIEKRGWRTSVSQEEPPTGLPDPLSDLS